MKVMTESRREIWARAASETISRQQQFNDDNIGDRVYLPQLERRQRQQLNQQQQTRTFTDEKIQLEEDVEVAREAAVRLVRRVGSLPTSRSFLNLGLCLLSAMRSPTVYQLLGATWHFKVRYGQCVIAEALAGVAEEDVAAFEEAIIRGNVDILRCKDIPVLLPHAHDLRTNEGAVIIRNALKRECDLSDEAQEKEWAQERLQDTRYREYMAEKEAALAGLTKARAASANVSRSRSLSSDRVRDSERRNAFPPRPRSLSTVGQVANKIEELPVPTPLDDEDYDDIFIAQPPESLPALLTMPSSQESIAEHAGEDVSNRSGDDTPEVKMSASLFPSTQESETPGGKAPPSVFTCLEAPPPLAVKIFPPPSSSDEEVASTPPLTPPRTSPAALSNEPSAVEPSPFDLKASTPPPPPRTFSTNPLQGMFNTPLDKPCVVFVVNDILCSERVMNDRRKAKKVLMELEKGCIQAETLEWIIRGLRSPRGKREMAQRLHGLEFVGPQWGVPKYKTGKGLRHLLKGIAGKHAGGDRFVVCVSSSRSCNEGNNVQMVTGVLSERPDAPTSDTARRLQPVMDGEVPGLEDWVNASTCGNLDDGSQLWTWVY